MTNYVDNSEGGSLNYFGRLSLVDRVIQYFRFRIVCKHILKGSFVIDFGSGDGSFLFHFKDKILRGVALDRYPSSRELVNILFLPFNIDSDDYHKIPGAGKADIITSMAVIEHVKSPENFIKLSFNLLKSGGSFVLTTPTPRSRRLLEFLAFKLGLISRKEILDHRQYLWGYQLYTMALDAGFKSAKWREFEFGMNTLFVAIK